MTHTPTETELRDSLNDAREEKARAFRLWQESGSDKNRDAHRSQFFACCARMREIDAHLHERERGITELSANGAAGTRRPER